MILLHIELDQFLNMIIPSPQGDFVAQRTIGGRLNMRKPYTE